MDIKVKIGLGVLGSVVTLLTAGLIRNKLRDTFEVISTQPGEHRNHIVFRKKIPGGAVGLVSVLANATLVQTPDGLGYLTYWSDVAQYNLELSEEEVRYILDYLVGRREMPLYDELVNFDGVWQFKYID